MKTYIIKEVLPKKSDALYVVIAKDSSEAKEKITHVFRNLAEKLYVIASLDKGVQFVGFLEK